MPISEAVRTCFLELQGHIESLQSQLDALRAQQGQEQQLSKKNLDGIDDLDTLLCDLQVHKPKSDWHRAASDRHRAASLPGTLPGSIPDLSGADAGAGFRDDHSLQQPTAQFVLQRVSTEDVEQAESMLLAENRLGLLRKDIFVLSEYEEAQAKTCREQIFRIVFGRTDEKDKPILQRLVHGFFFKAACMSAIIANAIYLGIAADFNVRNSYRPVMCKINGVTGADCEKLPEGGSLDVVFVIWFCIEIFLKLIADRSKFFCGDDMWWNLFDTFLVLESIIGIAFDSGRLVLLRILRVFRLVRIVRLVRSMKALRRLRTMIYSIMNSFIDLLWAMLVVLLIVFVFGIFFGNAASSYFDIIATTDNFSDLQVAQDVHKQFGDLGKTMLSLWSAVSGGNDWMMYGELILQLHNGAVFFIAFNFYIAFCVVGLFNVVTGVFVDSAVCSRTEDEVVAGYIENLKSTSAEIRQMFKDADSTTSGTLTYEEFFRHLSDPLVQAYFSGLEIDPVEAPTIFAILDTDNSNELSIDEFVNGTMKLKGYASKLDMMTMLFDQTKQHNKFDKLCAFVHTELGDIKDKLDKLHARDTLRVNARHSNDAAPRREVTSNLPSSAETGTTRTVAERRVISFRHGYM